MSDVVVKSGTSLPEGFPYTQSKLQDFLDCPRRFYLKYIEGQRWPAPITEPQKDFEKRLRRGQQMHQLIEQHLLGIPEEIVQHQIPPYDELLNDWWAEYTYQCKALADLPIIYPEILLSMMIERHLILAKFDAITVDAAQNVVAIDWKTGKLPPPAKLETRMQTVLYLAVLYRATKSLLGQQPQSITLRYISLATGEIQSFHVTALNIANLEMQVFNVIEQIHASSFDKIIHEDPCRFCVYRGLCGRGTTGIMPYEDTDAIAENSDGFDWYSDIDSYAVEF